MRYNRYWNKNGCIVETDHTWQLASFAQNLRYENLSEDVIEKAKEILVTTVGAALAAGDLTVSDSVEKLALEGNNGEGGTTTVWGCGKKMSALNSALVNGTRAHLLDWEDNSYTGHPSAAVVPAAIAAAEERHESGKKVLEAIVAAYEVYQRIAMAVQPTEEAWKKKGWGQNSWQIFAAAIAAGKIYDFDARKFDQTIGMCCESSPLGCDFAARTASDFYYYEFGFRVRDGLMATKAVDNGIWNARDTLDEQACYYGVICDNPDTEWFTKELGDRYLILETALKKFPGNLFLQGAIEAVKDIMKENELSPSAVRSIWLDPVAKEQQLQPGDHLKTRQGSASYTIAANLLKGYDVWSSEKEQEVQSAAEKIQFGESETDIPALYTALRKNQLPTQSVKVTTVGGETYSRNIDMVLSPSKEEIRENFMTQAAKAIGQTKAQLLYDQLMKMETVSDVTEITAVL